MRKRAEIEEELEYDVYEGEGVYRKEGTPAPELCLEVLLDIRDLLKEM